MAHDDGGLFPLGMGSAQAPAAPPVATPVVQAAPPIDRPVHACPSGALLTLTLAELERRAGRLDESAKHARTAQEIFAHALSQDDVRQARPFTVLGVTQTWRGQYADALANYEKALAIQIRAVGEDHIVTVTSHGNIAEMLFELNRYDDVLVHVTRFEDGLDKLHKTHPLYRSFGHRLRAQWLLHEKKYDEAISLLEKALNLVKDLPGSALDRAAIEWILAQALSGKKPTAARARDLAQSARNTFAANGIAGEDRIRAIDAWLGSSKNTPPKPAK